MEETTITCPKCGSLDTADIKYVLSTKRSRAIAYGSWLLGFFIAILISDKWMIHLLGGLLGIFLPMIVIKIASKGKKNVCRKCYATF